MDRGQKLDHEPLRILPRQYERLEAEIDDLNAELAPLRSFALPGGHAAAAHLHLCRTICRRAERLLVQLSRTSTVSTEALAYLNRLSDLLFVMARAANHRGGGGEVQWVPSSARQD